MQELIGSVVIILGLVGAGTFTVREVQDTVRRAAIENVAVGMPSLTQLTRAIRGHQK
jgi:hypothetical protein